MYHHAGPMGREGTRRPASALGAIAGALGAILATSLACFLAPWILLPNIASDRSAGSIVMAALVTSVLLSPVLGAASAAWAGAFRLGNRAPGRVAPPSLKRGALLAVAFALVPYALWSVFSIVSAP